MTAIDKINILMIDKDPLRLLSYEAILEELGENLIKVNSASDAREILEKTDVAVVLMSLSPGETENVDLAAIMRQDLRFQKTAILVMCDGDLAGNEEKLRCGNETVDFVLARVAPEELRARIRVFVELHRRMRKLEAQNGELERLVAAFMEELNKSETQLGMLAELMNIASEAIMVRGLDDSIQFWSPGAESLYGWRREEVLGKEIHSVLRTVFPEPREEIDRALREHKRWQGNLTQRAKDGTEVVVACRKSMNHEGTAVLEVGRDITAQLRTEQTLRESEKLAAMGRVAGIIAHEINNPLAAITNLFYLLRHHPSLDAEARHCAEMAEEELERVTYITRQTLSFYRESRRPIPVLLPELLDDVLRLQDRALKLSHIALKKKFNFPAQVSGFPGELRQVFLNLISNAIQAMPEGGTLGIHVYEATDWTRQRRGVVASILDTGKGIQPEDARQLFEPFFSTKSTKGTGLGLWISKGIVQKYDGRISCRSYRHAGGCATCFRIFLPLSGAQNLPVGHVAEALPASHISANEEMSASGIEAPMIHAVKSGMTFDMPASV